MQHDDTLPKLPSGVDLVRVGLTSAVAVLAVAVVVLWFTRGDTTPFFDPLGEYPTQTVNDDDGLIDVVDGFISVTGTKCRGDSPLRVEGQLAWRREAPAGFVSALFVFPAADVPAGCVTSTFANDIPPDVAESVCEVGTSVWRITGSETPLGRIVGGAFVAVPNGVTHGWATEPFTLTCPGGIPQ